MPAVASFLSLQLCKVSSHTKRILCNTCHLGNKVMGHYEWPGGHAYIHVACFVLIGKTGPIIVSLFKS